MTNIIAKCEDNLQSSYSKEHSEKVYCDKCYFCEIY